MVAEYRRRNNRLWNCLLCYCDIAKDVCEKAGPERHTRLVGRQGRYNCTTHYLANTEISRGGSCLKVNGGKTLAEQILNVFPWCWNLFPSWCPRNQQSVTSQQCYKAHFFCWASKETKSRRSEEFYYVCFGEPFISLVCLPGNIYCWSGMGSPLQSSLQKLNSVRETQPWEESLFILFISVPNIIQEECWIISSLVLYTCKFLNVNGDQCRDWYFPFHFRAATWEALADTLYISRNQWQTSTPSTILQNKWKWILLKEIKKRNKGIADNRYLESTKHGMKRKKILP